MTSSKSYALNKEKCKINNRRTKQRMAIEFKEFLSKEKYGKPCVDCHKIFHWSCMDYDHKPGAVKKFKISQGNGQSKIAVEKELEKCELRCSNCHRIVTKKRQITKPQIYLSGYRKYIREIKSNNKCVDCQSFYPYECMTFDHVPERGKKLFNIAHALKKNTSLEQLNEEIKKCDLLCFNCHNLRTYCRNQK